MTAQGITKTIALPRKIPDKVRAEIIKSCIDDRKAGEDIVDLYPSQIATIEKIFQAVEEGKKLSLDFILELCKSLSPDVNSCNPDFDRFHIELRTKTVGYIKVPIGKSMKDGLTSEGIREILDIISEEEKTEYPVIEGQWQGTVLCEYSLIKNWKGSVYTSLPKPWDEKQLVEEIFRKSQEEFYYYGCPLTNDKRIGRKEFLENTMRAYIDTFNQNIESSKNLDEEKKKELIIKLIKQCIRLHPCKDGNHRLFAFAVLLFLLLRYLNKYCVLSNRHQFMFNGLSESLKAVKLIPVLPEDIKSNEVLQKNYPPVLRPAAELKKHQASELKQHLLSDDAKEISKVKATNCPCAIL